jgi:hypothetical protein
MVEIKNIINYIKRKWLFLLIVLVGILANIWIWVFEVFEVSL